MASISPPLSSPSLLLRPGVSSAPITSRNRKHTGRGWPSWSTASATTDSSSSGMTSSSSVRSTTGVLCFSGPARRRLHRHEAHGVDPRRRQLRLRRPVPLRRQPARHAGARPLVLKVQTSVCQHAGVLTPSFFPGVRFESSWWRSVELGFSSSI